MRCVFLLLLLVSVADNMIVPMRSSVIAVPRLGVFYNELGCNAEECAIM